MPATLIMGTGSGLRVKILLAATNPLNYSFRRGLIESIEGGCDVFLSSGVMAKQNIAVNGIQQVAIQDNRTFEGWKHENI